MGSARPREGLAGVPTRPFGFFTIVFTSAPAVLQAPCGVLGAETGHGLVADELCTGVLEAAGLAAVLGELYDRVHAHLGHLLRELHDGGKVLAVFDVPDSLTAAVD